MEALWFSVVALLQVAPPAAERPPEPGDIVITAPGKAAEQQTVTGSRVRPAPPLADFRGTVSQIASDTGVAGLSQGSGMDPFAGGSRKITVKGCKGSDPRISSTSCAELARAQKSLELRDFPRAIATVDRILTNPKSTAVDRFYAHRFGYEIAHTEGDQLGRIEALRGMIASGLLSRNDRKAATKTVAAILLARGDEVAAIKELELLIRDHPQEVTANANLAALYDRHGRHSEARGRMLAAVQIKQSRGEPVPASWTEYVGREGPSGSAPRR